MTLRQLIVDKTYPILFSALFFLLLFEFFNKSLVLFEERIDVFFLQSFSGFNGLFLGMA